MSEFSSKFSLLSVPGLESLARTCEELGVTLTAHGGFARRVARAALAAGVRSELPDVFSLTRFGADIDLVHTGPPTLNAPVLNSIYANVPGGESLRWEVRSEEEELWFRQAKKVADVVPANLLRLSSLSGSWFEDPWGGLEDIEQEKYRFIRNGYYSTSALLLAGRDLEVFAALRYLLALADAGLWEPKEGRSQLAVQPGHDAALEVLDEAISRPTIIRLQESAYLRACLRHLVRKLGVAVPRSARRTAVAKRLQEVLVALEAAVPALGGLGAVFSPLRSQTVVGSQRLGGDAYRLHELTEDWLSGEDAEAALENALSSLPGPARKGCLMEGQRVLLASSPLPLNAGTALSESSLGEPEDTAHELVELAIPLQPEAGSGARLSALDGFEDDSLAMVFSLLGLSETVALFPSLSTCRFEHRGSSAPADDLLTVRGSCYKVLERATEIAEKLSQTSSPPYLQLWILGCGEGLR